MALNPPVSNEGIPLRVEGEYMVLNRKNCEFEGKIQNLGKVSGKGTLFLTTARIVFVDKDFTTKDFKSFDIPLAFLSKEKFNQPIFGANYLSGSAKPLYNLLPGETEFKIWFMSGGCQKFLDLFCRILEQMRKRQFQGPDPAFIDSLRSGRLEQNLAYADPSDPSTIYITQPQDTFQSASASNSYGGYQGIPIGTNYPQPSNAPQPSNIPPYSTNQQQQQYYGAPQQPQQYSPPQYGQYGAPPPQPQPYSQPPQPQNQQYQQQQQQGYAGFQQGGVLIGSQQPVQQQYPQQQYQQPNYQNPYPQLDDQLQQQQQPTGQYAPPPPPEYLQQQQLQQQQQQQQQVPPIPQQNQNQNMNVGFYYGFGLGPRLVPNNPR